MEKKCFLCNKLKLSVNIPPHFSTSAFLFPLAASEDPSNWEGPATLPSDVSAYNRFARNLITE